LLQLDASDPVRQRLREKIGKRPANRVLATATED
jgi:hypothetical protein